MTCQSVGAALLRVRLSAIELLALPGLTSPLADQLQAVNEAALHAALGTLPFAREETLSVP